jgi:hypothetical protein
MAVQVNVTNADGSVTTYVKLCATNWEDPSFGNGTTSLRYLAYADAAHYQTAEASGNLTAYAQNCAATAGQITIPSTGLISTPTGTATPEQFFDNAVLASPNNPFPGGVQVP